MAAPTFIAEYEAVWNNNSQFLTKSVTVAVDDVLLVLVGMENGNRTISSPTGVTGVTWDEIQPNADNSSWASVCIFHGVATVAGTFTMSLESSGPNMWGYNCLRFSGSDGIGITASNGTQANGTAPTFNLITTEPDSAVGVICVDWNATDGASRIVRTGPGAFTELSYFRDAGVYTAYAGYYPDVDAAGSKTVGWSAPTGQKWTLVAVEILGSAGAGTTPVTKTASLGWNLRTDLTKTAQARWNLRSSLTKTAQARWNLRTSVTKTVQARWNLRTSISKTVQSRWNIRSSVTKSASVLWGVAGAVFKSTQSRWNVRNTTTKTAQSRWNVRTGLAKTSQSRWNIRTAFSKTGSLRWNLLSSLIKTAQSRWNILTDEPDVITFRWTGTPHASPSEKVVNGVVADVNDFTNPSLETNIVNWGGAIGGLSTIRDSGFAFSGDWSLKAYWTSGPSTYFRVAQWGMNVSAGETCWVKLRVYLPATNSFNPTNIRVMFRDDFIGTTYQSDVLNLVPTEDNWYEVKVQHTVPVGYTFTRAYLDILGTDMALSDVQYLDGWQVTKTDSYYFDGDTKIEPRVNDRLPSDFMLGDIPVEQLALGDKIVWTR